MSLELVLGGAVLVAVIVLALEKRKSGRLARELGEVREKLDEQLIGPRVEEYRVEQFDLLWYPTVTWSPKESAVLKTTAGVPHCKACAAAMKSQDGGKLWACEPCKRQAPGSITDLAVMDQVVKLALKYFAERHPGVRIPPK